MADLSDHEIKNLLATLQDDLQQFPEGMNSLEMELESASKHVPAYVKIVKGHIDQLRTVLQLENHNHRSLESVGLARPVQQLIKIFDQLEADDMQLLEELAYAARNWELDASDEVVTEKETAETTAG